CYLHRPGHRRHLAADRHNQRLYRPAGTLLMAVTDPSANAATGDRDSALRRTLRHIWRPFRQSSRTSRALIFVGLGVLVFFILLAAIGPVISPYDAVQYRVETAPGQFASIAQLAPPSAEHWFGTTRDGFDVMARIIGGAKLALIVMALAVSQAMVIGVPLGLASGYHGGKIDRTLVTIMDAIYAFPPLV